MTEVRIRRPTSNEIDAVRGVVQTVVDETYGGLWAAPPLPIDEDEWSHSWVAVADGSVVGMILTDEEWISDLWVVREYRRCGVGHGLLVTGEAEIIRRGHATLKLRVVKSNSTALRFYERHFWQITREFQHEQFKVPMLEMTKGA
jgi:ribosomal protein S18 acetylase RimI-like enzyme